MIDAVTEAERQHVWALADEINAVIEGEPVGIIMAALALAMENVAACTGPPERASLLLESLMMGMRRDMAMRQEPVGKVQ